MSSKKKRFFLDSLKRWHCRANLITVRIIRLPVPRQARSESDMKLWISQFPGQRSWNEVVGRNSAQRSSRWTAQTIIQPRIPPPAMSLSKRRRFTGCVTSYRSPHLRFQKAARTPNLWAARTTRSLEKKIQEEAATIREGRKTSSTRCLPQISFSRA